MITLALPYSEVLFNENDNGFLYGFFGTTLGIEIISYLQDNDFDKVISTIVTYFSQNKEKEFSQADINTLFKEIHRLSRYSKINFPHFVKELILSLLSNTQKLKQSDRTTFIRKIVALRVYFSIADHKSFSGNTLLDQLNEVNILNPKAK